MRTRRSLPRRTSRSTSKRPSRRRPRRSSPRWPLRVRWPRHEKELSTCGSSLQYHDDLYAARDAAIDAKRGEEARLYREAAWQKIEDGHAADRRRAAGLNVDQMRIVRHFIEWATHVDRFRVAGQIPEAVQAWQRMQAVIHEHDPADADGENRLWNFARTELRRYYQLSRDSDKRYVKDGCFDFWIDCLGGFYRAFESKPEPSPSAAPSGDKTGERADGGASSERIDTDCVRQP